MSTARHSHPSHEKTILRRAMAAWCLEDITPPRMSQEAEETKEKWKRKVQIMFLVPSVKFRHPMPAFRLLEYLIRFWSYQACDYTVMKPRIWPTCWSSSNENRLSSHGDIHPTIQMFISLVTMEPALHVILLLLQTTITPYSRVSLSPSSQILPGTSHPFLLPQSPLFLVSVSSSSVSCLAFSLVISGLSSGLRGLIWLSLCPLSPLPMVLVSCTPAKSSFPSRSWHFLDCNEFSIHISLIYLWMISTDVSVLLFPPWSTDRKKNPLLSFPRRELVKGACFPLSAALRTLALHFSAPKV